MRNVQGEDTDRLLVPTLVSASHPEEVSPPDGLRETVHAKQDWEDVRECGRWLSVAPRERAGPQTKSWGKPNARRDIRKEAVVCAQVVDRDRFASLLNVGSSGWMGGIMMGGQGNGGGSPWAKPQLRDIINSKPAAKQHDLCSLRKYHSTLFTKNREGE